MNRIFKIKKNIINCLNPQIVLALCMYLFTFLLRIPAHIVVKGNKEADKVKKQAIDIPGMTTTKLTYTD